uniref:RNA1 polyprotein n=1 Tax=Reaumuria songarica fabavirus TaxID=3115798 RepID=A0AAT9J7T9_9SECO
MLYSSLPFALNDAHFNFLVDCCVSPVDSDNSDISLREKRLVCLIAYDNFVAEVGENCQQSSYLDNLCIDNMNALMLASADSRRSLIRTFFIDRFECDVEFPSDGNQSSVGQIGVPQIIKSSFASVCSAAISRASAFKNGMRGACESACDWVWMQIEEAFKIALGRYYAALCKAASWVKDIWTTMRTWCDNLVKEHIAWMNSFKECLSLGMAVVGVAAVLTLLEKFMIAGGIIAGPLDLTSTFLLCFLGYLGYQEGGSFFQSTGKMVVELLNACKSTVRSLSTLFGATGTEGQSADDILETFAMNIGNFDLVKTGRHFNAITQIASGIKNVWQCVQHICGYLWSVLDKCFGIQSRALADLSVMLGYDVQGWLRRCDAACEFLVLHNSAPQDILRTLRVLRSNGQNIRCALMKRDVRGSAAALATINKALERLESLLNNAIMAGSGGPRNEPLWVYVHGAPGVGKSTLTNVLVSHYLKSKELDFTDAYPRNTLDKFWSNYRRQTVVTYDDLGALSSNDNCEEAELLKLVSRDAHPLNLAGVDEKGIYFDSSLIVSSSNFISANPKANIHDKVAYDRRRGLLVEVVFKNPDQRKDPDDTLGHQRYIVKEPVEPYRQIHSFDNFLDFYAYFLDVVAQHEEVQEKISKSADIPEKTISNSLSMLAGAFAGVVPGTIQSACVKRHPGYQFLVYSDDAMYFINARGRSNDIIVDRNFEDIDSEDIDKARKDAQLTAMRYCQTLREMPLLDPMTAHFLVELVSKAVYDKDLKVVKSRIAKDISLLDVAESLPDWQRVLVRVMSEATTRDGKGWFSRLYDDLVSDFQRSHLLEIRTWPWIVKLSVGMMAFLIFGKGILYAISKLGNFGYGAGFSMAAVRVFCFGQSDDEERRKTSEYRHRNIPVRTRHWSSGQNFGVSYEWLMKHCLAYLRCGQREGQVVVLPGRRLVGVIHFLSKLPDGAMVEISMDEQVYHICWHKSRFKELADSELGVYQHEMIRETAKSLNDRISYGVEHLPDSFQAMFCSCKRDELSGDYVPEVANLVVKKRNAALHIYAGNYQRLVPISLEYEGATVNKDCGSLIVANINGVDKLVGIHVAGIGNRGQACFIPSELQISYGQNFEINDVDVFPFEEQVGNGLSMVGLLKKEKSFHTVQKTAYKQTPDSWHLKTPCEKVPAILEKGDVRLRGTEHEGYDPYRNGLLKYVQEAGPFDDGILEEVCDGILETWYDAGSTFDLGEVSLEDTINGVEGVEYFDPLVMNTSEGYPHVLSREGTKGKSRFFSYDQGKLVPTPYLEGCIEKLESEAAERVPELVGIEHAKDEKLPRRKIFEKPKTRLFTVVPMEFNIVLRKKFLRFVRFIMMRRDVLPCQVGINPYSREWNRLAVSLLEKGDDILCCDYSSFDGLLGKHVMCHIARIINKFCGGDTRLCEQRKNLLLSCCSRYGISAGKVWRIENGIPSGVALTVILNSIFNEVIIKYIYRVAVKDKLLGASFDRYIKMVTYGDDNLISVSPTIHELFNGSIVKEGAHALGITITDGCDKTLPAIEFRSLTSCDFLKRSFRKIDGLWQGPMDMDSLWSQLHWVKTTHLEMAEAYLVNLESVLRELFLHDEGLVRLYRRRALSLGWITAENVPTIEQIRAFYDQQLNGYGVDGFGYDNLITPTQLGPLVHGKAKEMGPFEVGNFVATITTIYNYQDGDFVITLGRVANRFGNDGMVVAWDVGSGRGDLPNTGWLRCNYLRENAEIIKKIKTASCNYKRIVFLGKNSVVFPAIFLVLYLKVTDSISVEKTNLALTKAIEVTKSLGYLVNDFPELFFEGKRVRPDSVLFRRKHLAGFGTRFFVDSVREVLSGVAIEHAGQAPPCVVGEDKMGVLEWRASMCRQLGRIVGCFATWFIDDKDITSLVDGDLNIGFSDGEIECVFSVFEDGAVDHYSFKHKVVCHKRGKFSKSVMFDNKCLDAMTISERLVLFPLHRAVRDFSLKCC